jgi:outer membrane protein assembly factor BamB
MAVSFDQQRIYATEENEPGRNREKGLEFDNGVVAYDRQSHQRLWQTESPDLKHVCCLAPPLPYEGRLYMPVLARGWFTLFCLEPGSGQVLWKMPIHSGGTDFARPPAVPLVAGDGLVYYLTNAGAVAAVDAINGRLRWIRRYERSDPHDSPPRLAGRVNRSINYGMPQERSIEGFAASTPILVGGRLVIAPADGTVILGLDAATGEMLWLNPKKRGSRESHFAASELDYVVGHNGHNLYMAGDWLQCIEIRSGIRLWERRVDKFNGRGVVTADAVYLPSDGYLMRVAADGSGELDRIPVQAQVADRPLTPPYNLAFHQSHMVVAARDMVAVFSDYDDWLGRIAAQPVVAAVDPSGGAPQGGDPLYGDLRMVQERAEISWRAGDSRAAVELYEQLVAGTATTPAVGEWQRRLTHVASAEALRLARANERASALALLDRTLSTCGGDRENRLRLMVQRLDVYKALGDTLGLARAREDFHDYLDSR